IADGQSGDAAGEADAMVNATPERTLAVLVADCVPVVLADAEAGVVGVAHAGRVGLAAGIVPAVVRTMRGLGARKLCARVGPAVVWRSYVMRAEIRDEVSAVVPETWAVSRTGTPSLDLLAGVVAHLRAIAADVDVVGSCTVEDDLSYSYRRD